MANNANSCSGESNGMKCCLDEEGAGKKVCFECLSVEASKLRVTPVYVTPIEIKAPTILIQIY